MSPKSKTESPEELTEKTERGSERQREILSCAGGDARGPLKDLN